MVTYRTGEQVPPPGRNQKNFKLSNVFFQIQNSFPRLVCYPENQIDRNDVIFAPYPSNIMLIQKKKYFFCFLSHFIFFFFSNSISTTYGLSDAWVGNILFKIFKVLFQNDIHTLSNIHILTYGISGATGAERRSRACVTGGISLSPLRGQSLSSSLFPFFQWKIDAEGISLQGGWVVNICCFCRLSLSRSVYTQEQEEDMLY